MATGEYSTMDILKLAKGGNPMQNLQTLNSQQTSDDVAASSLAEIANGFQASDPVSALLKGITGGVALTKKGKAQVQRDINNQQMRELLDYEMKLKQRQGAIEEAAMAHVEATQSGAQLAQALEQAQLGDESGVPNWLAANPGSAKLLQSRIGVPIDGAKVVNISGVDVIQAYGKGQDGSLVMDPNPVPVDAMLKAYAPEAYAARSVQRLEQANAQLKNDNLTADLETEQARANAIRSPAPAAAPSSAPSPASGAAPGAKPVKMTEAQSKNTNFGLRMQGAMQTLSGLEGSKEFNPTSLWSAGLKNIAEGEGGILSLVPGAGAAANASLSADAQKYFQAQKEFLAGILRGDTGAAITREEFQLYGPMYFPMPGDKPETVKLKSEARQRALDGVKVVAGPGGPAIDEAQRGQELKAKYGLE
jgi:hypothetical protein